MLPLKWCLFVAVPLVLLTIFFLRHLVRSVCQARSFVGFEETSEQYQREMHYLESFVFHVAFKEGAVSQARVWQLIPGASDCSSCRRHLQLIFCFGIMRGELLVTDQTTGSYHLSPHATSVVAASEAFQDFGRAWVLPASKITFEHQACHAEHSS